MTHDGDPDVIERIAIMGKAWVAAGGGDIIYVRQWHDLLALAIRRELDARPNYAVLIDDVPQGAR